jgi:hypothetical protein
VTALLNAKLRLIGCHIVRVGSLSEAIGHPARDIPRDDSGRCLRARSHPQPPLG